MRYFVALALIVSCCGSAWAQDQETPPPQSLTAVYHCAAVTSETERLACYDAAVRQLQAAQDSGDIVVVDRQQAETVRHESFGLSMPSLVRIFTDRPGAHRFEPIDNVQMQIQRIGGAGNGRSRFYMANGQTWVTVEPVSTRSVREGETITIRQGAFHSYMLSPPRGGAGIRVRREE